MHEAFLKQNWNIFKSNKGMKTYSTLWQVAYSLRTFCHFISLIFDLIFIHVPSIYFCVYMRIKEKRSSALETSCFLSVFIRRNCGESIQYQKSIIVILSSRLLWCLYCVLWIELYFLSKIHPNGKHVKAFTTSIKKTKRLKWHWRKAHFLVFV